MNQANQSSLDAEEPISAVDGYEKTRNRRKPNTSIDLRALSGDTLRKKIGEIYVVDPVAGHFYHKERPDGRKVLSGGRRPGDPAGSPPRRSTTERPGYWRISAFGRNYVRSRIMWAYVKGEWPELSVDHIDGDTENDSFSNLRLATASQQAANYRTYRNNTSGHRGVTPLDRNGKRRYLAYIGTGQNRISKSFKTMDAAITQRLSWERELFGDFARKAPTR